jgi:hypothetical protein
MPLRGTAEPLSTTGIFGSVIVASPASAANRGLLIRIAKVTAYNLNNVAQVTLFTFPAAGFVNALLNELVLDNFSGASGSVQVSFGSSGTPTDFLGTQTLTNGATGKAISLYPAMGAAYATYGVGVAFAANQTVAQGVATTCDISIWGYYE